MRNWTARLTLALVASALVVLATSSAAASIVEYDVGIDGFGCPMCVDSLEKRLEPLEGLEDLEVDMGAGTATFEVDESAVLMPGEVAEAVDEANLSVREINVVAEGTARQDGDEWQLELSEDETIGLNVEDELGEQLEEGDQVEVSGEALEEGGWTIEVREVSTP